MGIPSIQDFLIDTTNWGGGEGEEPMRTGALTYERNFRKQENGGESEGTT